ncbi:MAG: DEAD/DEAH box helicase [Methanospirillaceae archaeon]|nr:DEAD/DEAH box helicase [Methanospirillaceae archaeon]
MERQSAFYSLSLSLQDLIRNRLGWRSFFEIQEESYLAFQSDTDLLIMAPTASGKSEAAFLPVIDSYLKKGDQGIFCLYISPQKALINDIKIRLQDICLPLHIPVKKWHGDIPARDRHFPEDTPVILLTTPESLEVLFHNPAFLPAFLPVTVIIIDEVHSFIPTDRGVHLSCLLDRLDLYCNRKLKRIGLSATIGDPGAVASWLSGPKREAVVVALPVCPRMKEIIFSVCKKEDIPGRITDLVAGKRSLVFVESRFRAEKLTRTLRRSALPVRIHHGSLGQESRYEAEQLLLSGMPVCLVCTSTMELGIDIGGLDIVLQVGPPRQVSSWIQRLGRSGRRGTTPVIACILTSPDQLAQTVAVIECAVHNELEVLAPPRYPYLVLARQILLYVADAGRVPLSGIVGYIRKLSVFRYIPDEDITGIITHMVAEGYLTADGDLLMIGITLEEQQKGGSFMEQYSTIVTGSVYSARSPDGEELGSLDAALVASAGENGRVLLAGEIWKITGIEKNQMIVHLFLAEETTSEEILNFWSGSGVSLSPCILTGLSRIIERGGSRFVPPGYMTEMLRSYCNGFPEGISDDTILLSLDAGSLCIFTFLGYRWNRIIAACLKHHFAGGFSHDLKIERLHDICLILRGRSITNPGQIVQALREIAYMDPADILACNADMITANHPGFSLIPPLLQQRIWIQDRLEIHGMQEAIREKRIIIRGSQSGRSE